MKKLLLALLILASTAAVTAQTTSTIEGTVRDPAGAAVADATVTIAGPGVERTVKSDQEGRYQILAVPPGRYTLTAVARGLRHRHADRSRGGPQPHAGARRRPVGGLDPADHPGHRRDTAARPHLLGDRRGDHARADGESAGQPGQLPRPGAARSRRHRQPRRRRRLRPGDAHTGRARGQRDPPGRWHAEPQRVRRWSLQPVQPELDLRVRGHHRRLQGRVRARQRRSDQRRDQERPGRLARHGRRFPARRRARLLEQPGGRTGSAAPRLLGLVPERGRADTPGPRLHVRLRRRHRRRPPAQLLVPAGDSAIRPRLRERLRPAHPPRADSAVRAVRRADRRPTPAHPVGQLHRGRHRRFPSPLPGHQPAVDPPHLRSGAHHDRLARHLDLRRRLDPLGLRRLSPVPRRFGCRPSRPPRGRSVHGLQRLQLHGDLRVLRRPRLGRVRLQHHGLPDRPGVRRVRLEPGSEPAASRPQGRRRLPAHRRRRPRARHRDQPTLRDRGELQSLRADLRRLFHPDHRRRAHRRRRARSACATTTPASTSRTTGR